MTTAISNKLIRIFLTALILVAAVYPLLSRNVNSASLTSLYDTMSRQDDSVASNHTIGFTLVSTWDATETVVIDFDNGFDTSGFANTEPEDFDITWNGSDKTIVANGSCAANSIEITTVNTSTDTFTFTLCSGSTASGATDPIIVEIGTNATTGSAGNDQITNPGSSGSKTITITGPGADSGTLAVPIMTDDQVTVSATVDPSITSSLSGTTCALGTLGVGAINFCSYTNTVNTNASSGYVSTIVENGNLCSPSVAVCTNTIDDETGDSDVDEGTEEYGVSSNDTTGTQDVVNSTGCDDSGTSEAATAITGTAKVYADSGDGDAGPVSNAVTTICHSASVAGVTPAGSYSHIVTHITTGTF